VINTELKLNYADEEIPDSVLLLKGAEESVQAIMGSKPQPILDNLVDSGTNEYLGRQFFREIEKTTSTYRSGSKNDFSGIYVFLKNDRAVYVGISNSVIRRLKYHLLADRENQSSFVYLMARRQYQTDNGAAYDGARKDFPFELYRQGFQTEMISEWKFIVHPCSGGYHLSFTEILLAASLKTPWNSFETH